MKTLKFLAFATVLAAPLSAQAMCGGDYMHSTATAAISEPVVASCAAGEVWDTAQSTCVATVG
ncbi:MAG: hypothetical protein AAFR53_09675 [Pseudomonadota bacterium]